MVLTKDLLEGLLSCAEAMYIIEEAGKTVVYTRGFTRKSRSGQSFEGEKCYRAFLGREEPCPFCPALCDMSPPDSQPYIWDYFDTTVNQWLKIKNRLLVSGGVTYRVGNVNVISDMMQLGSEAVREVGLMQQLIREREQIQEQLFYEMSHDRLTGLLNRNQYNRDLETIYKNPEACGILYLDLNNLKQANDRYNHAEGDALLIRLADAIRAVTGDGRRSYRIGGDEFLLIWLGCSKEELEHCRREILRELGLRNLGQRVPCSVAAGSAWSGGTQEMEQLVIMADQQMYEEKRRIKERGTK